MGNWEAVIGLEIHAQILTRTKMFCACDAAYGAPPNSRTCPVCLGHPGTLPVVNGEAVRQALKVAYALNCRVRPESRFARKNYFYPDLPKGYQITQFEAPLAEEGRLGIEAAGRALEVGILRAHIEEDSGKSLHEGFPDSDRKAYLDFNRAGVPLIEIVTAPELRSPEEAYAFLRRLKQVLTYLGASSGRMEEGALRCDVNVSLRAAGSAAMGTRVEVKNLNSFRNVERALSFEIGRQRDLLDAGQPVVGDTRLYDAARGATLSMRAKEGADDYRYFPEPDLPPLRVTGDMAAEARAALPELPGAKKARYMDGWGLSEYDADILIDRLGLALYFEEAVATCADPKAAANWVTGEVFRVLKDGEGDIGELKAGGRHLGELIALIRSGAVSSSGAKDVFARMIETGNPPGVLLDEMGLAQVSDVEVLGTFVQEVLAANPGPVEDLRSGRARALGYLIGQVMKRSGGRANPEVVSRMFRERLGMP